MTHRYFLSQVNRDKKHLVRFVTNGTNAAGVIIQKEMSKEARLQALELVEFVLYLHNKRTNANALERNYSQLLDNVLKDLKIDRGNFLDSLKKDESEVSSNLPQELSVFQKNTLLAIRKGLETSVQRYPFMVVFEDMAKFIGTKFGLFLTYGIILAGVTAFIVLTQQYNMGAVGGYTFLASVFGTFFIDMGASQVYKHCGLFKEKPALYTVNDSNDAGVEYERVPNNPQI